MWHTKENLKPIFHCHTKPFALGPCVGLDPPMPQSCWYLKTLKFALPQAQDPNVSRWNIGCVGSPTSHVQLVVEYRLKSNSKKDQAITTSNCKKSKYNMCTGHGSIVFISTHGLYIFSCTFHPSKIRIQSRTYRISETFFPIFLVG